MNLKKEIELNIPLFLGVILIFAIATTLLVYGVEQTKELILKENQKLDQEFERVENYFVNRFDETNETNEILEENTSNLLQN